MWSDGSTASSTSGPASTRSDEIHLGPARWGRRVGRDRRVVLSTRAGCRECRRAPAAIARSRNGAPGDRAGAARSIVAFDNGDDPSTVTLRMIVLGPASTRKTSVARSGLWVSTTRGADLGRADSPRPAAGASRSLRDRWSGHSWASPPYCSRTSRSSSFASDAGRALERDVVHRMARNQAKRELDASRARPCPESTTSLEPRIAGQPVARPAQRIKLQRLAGLDVDQAEERLRIDRAILDLHVERRSRSCRAGDRSDRDPARWPGRCRPGARGLPPRRDRASRVIKRRAGFGSRARRSGPRCERAPTKCGRPGRTRAG